MEKHDFRSFAEIELYELHNPNIFKTDADADAAARRYLESQLAHAKAMLEKTKRAVPGSAMYNAGAECEDKILKIEQWLEKHPAL